MKTSTNRVELPDGGHRLEYPDGVAEVYDAEGSLICVSCPKGSAASRALQDAIAIAAGVGGDDEAWAQDMNSVRDQILDKDFED